LGDFREEENGSLVCDNCGSSLVHISSAPEFLEQGELGV